GAGVADEANHLPGFDLYARSETARDRGQMEVLREDHPAPMREADIDTAMLIVAGAGHALDGPIVRRIGVLAPELAAEIGPAVAAMRTFGRAIPGPRNAVQVIARRRRPARRTRQRED